MPRGLPHPVLAADQSPGLLHAQAPGGQPLLQYGRVQRVNEQEGHLFMVMTAKEEDVF